MTQEENVGMINPPDRLAEFLEQQKLQDSMRKALTSPNREVPSIFKITPEDVRKYGSAPQVSETVDAAGPGKNPNTQAKPSDVSTRAHDDSVAAEDTSVQYVNSLGEETSIDHYKLGTRQSIVTHRAMISAGWKVKQELPKGEKKPITTQVAPV